MRRFEIGDTVLYDPGSKYRDAPQGPYTVIGFRPREDDATEYLYRIKSDRENTERVVPEDQLRQANGDGPTA